MYASHHEPQEGILLERFMDLNGFQFGSRIGFSLLSALIRLRDGLSIVSSFKQKQLAGRIQVRSATTNGGLV